MELPEKLFRMLEKLKRSGNKHYQFFENIEEYEARCKETDPTGYGVIFQDEAEENLEEEDTVQLNPEVSEDKRRNNPERKGDD